MIADEPDADDYEETVAEYLSRVVREEDSAQKKEWAHAGERGYSPDRPDEFWGWDEEFSGLVLLREAYHCEVAYTDAGGRGEEFVVAAFQRRWPDSNPEVTGLLGGCDSCGYGREVYHPVSWPEIPLGVDRG